MKIYKKATSLKSYEKESLLKSFALFFSVQLLFLSLVIYQHYHKVLHEYDMHVGNQIMQCHINGSCEKFQSIPVDDIGSQELHKFYKDTSIYMLFKHADAYVKVSTDTKTYLKKQREILLHVSIEYLLYLVVLVLESLFFALYALKPLKKALMLNEEFVKDILHDFNTPLSALKINLKILQKKYGKDEAIQRGDEAIENILSLQKNLRYYISQSKLQTEKLALHLILKERLNTIKPLYPNLNFSLELQETFIDANADMIVRIIDNLLSNACKYNKKEGSVTLILKDNTLHVKDSGIGIKNPKEVFNRHYKEHQRGIGIGLHIVQKLCDALHVKISLTSTLGVGSEFILDFRGLK